METLTGIFGTKQATPAEALEVFDSLAPVPLEFMYGRWKGYEISTGHHMDGLLEPTGWYGKLFLGPEEVHPLLMYTNKATRKALYAINPQLVPMHMQLPKLPALGFMMQLSRPIMQTRKTAARLRMMEYRGKITATMCYDTKAIFDHFVKVDENTVMGVMDLKGFPQPYAFVLERDDSTPYNYRF